MQQLRTDPNGVDVDELRAALLSSPAATAAAAADTYADVRGHLWMVLLGVGRLAGASGNVAATPDNAAATAAATAAAPPLSFDARAPALKACSRVAAKLPGLLSVCLCVCVCWLAD